MEFKQLLENLASHPIANVDIVALKECVGVLERRHKALDAAGHCLMLANLACGCDASSDLCAFVSKWKIEEYGLEDTVGFGFDRGELESAGVLIPLPDGKKDTVRVERKTIHSSSDPENEQSIVIRSTSNDLILEARLSLEEGGDDENRSIDADPDALARRYGLKTRDDVLFMFRALFAIIQGELVVGSVVASVN